MSLLLSTLAYFVGGVVGPALHSHWTGSAAAAAVSAPERDADAPAPDGERGCFVCQILGATGVPAVTVALPQHSVRPADALPPPLQSLSHREPAPSRARAPPPLPFL